MIDGVGTYFGRFTKPDNRSWKSPHSRTVLTARVPFKNDDGSSEASMTERKTQLRFGLAFVLLLVRCLTWDFSADAADTTQRIYDAVLTGKTCKARETGQILSCEYRVGSDLHFSIDGIGDPDTGISFLRSYFDGDYFATVGVMHGCVIVKHGNKTMPDNMSVYMSDFAFVSAKNGKVYRNWEDCRKAM
jgi:hypothetical protein